MNKKNPLVVAGIIFAIVSLIHLSRLFLNFSLNIAGYDVPLWLNGVGFVVALALSLWMLMASRN